jgi:hypothetical protein
MAEIKCEDILDPAGEEIDARIAGPYRDRRRLVVCAYHRGTRAGGSPKASLTLEMDGMLLGAAEDSGFDNYFLTLRRIVLLDVGTTASFVIRWTNNAATTTGHGIHVFPAPVVAADASLRVEV